MFVARYRMLPFAAAAAAVWLCGCHKIENQFAEDGPSSHVELDSATVRDLRAQGDADHPQRERHWEKSRFALRDGVVWHGPLYFQDPFEDKGAGHEERRMGWEDFVAAPYGFSRFTLNWLGSPVSMIVNPPWQTTESDGELSCQLLGYDHDPAPVDTDHRAANHDAAHQDAPQADAAIQTDPDVTEHSEADSETGDPQ